MTTMGEHGPVLGSTRCKMPSSDHIEQVKMSGTKKKKEPARPKWQPETMYCPNNDDDDNDGDTAAKRGELYPKLETMLNLSTATSELPLMMDGTSYPARLGDLNRAPVDPPQWSQQHKHQQHFNNDEASVCLSVSSWSQLDPLADSNNNSNLWNGEMLLNDMMTSKKDRRFSSAKPKYPRRRDFFSPTCSARTDLLLEEEEEPSEECKEEVSSRRGQSNPAEYPQDHDGYRYHEQLDGEESWLSLSTAKTNCLAQLLLLPRDKGLNPANGNDNERSVYGRRPPVSRREPGYHYQDEYQEQRPRDPRDRYYNDNWQLEDRSFGRREDNRYGDRGYYTDRYEDTRGHNPRYEPRHYRNEPSYAPRYGQEEPFYGRNDRREPRHYDRSHSRYESPPRSPYHYGHESQRGRDRYNGGHAVTHYGSDGESSRRRDPYTGDRTVTHYGSDDESSRRRNRYTGDHTVPHYSSKEESSRRRDRHTGDHTAPHYSSHEEQQDPVEVQDKQDDAAKGVDCRITKDETSRGTRSHVSRPRDCNQKGMEKASLKKASLNDDSIYGGSSVSASSRGTVITQPGAFHAKPKGQFKEDKPVVISSSNVPVYIEVSPGVRERLRRAQETRDAVARDFFAPAHCFACDSDVFCIADIRYFICPDCKCVNPLEEDGEFGVRHRTDVGIAFGFKALYKMQANMVFG